MDEEAEDTLLLRLYTGEFDRTASVYTTPQDKPLEIVPEKPKTESRKRKLAYSSDDGPSEEEDEEEQGGPNKRARVR